MMKKLKSMKWSMKIQSYLIKMVLVIFIPGLVYGQGASFTQLGDWGAAAYWDVFVKYNHAYCAADQGGVDVIDISTPAGPKRVATIDAVGAYDVYVSGGYLYVARRFSGISIYDLFNPASPSLTGHFETRNIVTHIEVHGQYAYVVNNYLDVTGSYGELLILDISNPAAPVQKAKFNTAEILSDLSVSGNYVYLASHVYNPTNPLEDGVMLVIDISNIASPQKVGEYDTPGDAWGIFVSGGYAYVADGRSGLQVIDIGNPAAPVLKGSIDTPGALALDVQAVGNYAYVVNGVEGLEIIDVSNPAAPTAASAYDTRWNSNNLHVIGNYAYIANTGGGLKVIDVSTPANPSQTGFFDQSIHLREIKTSGNYAFIGSNDGLQVFNVSDTSNPAPVSYYRPYTWMETHGFDIGGGYIYLISNEGFDIVDVSNPAMPQQAGYANILPPDGISVKGNYSYIVEAVDGLSIYDTSDPANPKFKGSVETGDNYNTSVFAGGNYAYIIGSQGFYIADVSTPSAPAIVKTYSQFNTFTDVYVSGNYAYLTGRGLTVLDISNPLSAKVIFHKLIFPCRDVVVKGNYAYVAALEAGLRIYDLSDPSAVTLVGSYTGGPVEHLDVKDNIIYTVYGPSGRLRLLSFTLPPRIALDKTSLKFSATTTGIVSSPQTIYINNTGEGNLRWTAFTNREWLKCSFASGINSGVNSIYVEPAGLAPGTYTGTVTVSDPGAVNSPQTVSVSLTVSNASSLSVPFGQFATPIDHSVVRGSIPVTGWALDDIGVESVKIYRELGNGLVYIGDAVFVEGARPDVQGAYPDYPNNSRAGWGYMLLTNFLPGGGNGSFTLHAIATDTEGNPVTLGTQIIHCDNANAIKPFGAIDTPTQGGTAAGDRYVNFGWALTPQPNSIPTDGSSIDVWVDGVNLGHPVYNNYRSDIAMLFPGYANSDGAIGYFYLDTTAYLNGVHTIQWTVRDDAGNTDGIGSRYFTVQNQGSRSAGQSYTAGQVPGMVRTRRDPVTVKTGFGKNTAEGLNHADDQGVILVETEELQCLEVIFFHPSTGRRLIPRVSLPIGSSLDSKSGVFRWMPGPGFVGLYPFVFDIKEPDGTFSRQQVLVRILPRQSQGSKILHGRE
jgi:hypothetical protein